MRNWSPASMCTRVSVVEEDFYLPLEPWHNTVSVNKPQCRRFRAVEMC